MRRIVMISIFIFLTGLFSGLFFSLGIAPDSHDHLSSLLLSGLSSSPGFFRSLASSLLSNLIPAALMLPALFTGLLSPLPMAILFFKSFSLGFCCGLIQTSAADNVFLISLAKLFPQNLFFIPAFILLASAVFHCSVTGAAQKNRPSREKKSLKNVCVIAAILILAGCITQEAFRLIAL